MGDCDSDKRRFRLVLAYDGRPFSGWQSQAGGNTIQDILLDGLRSICPEIETVQGSGRTDAGVSAEGQVAHFDAPEAWRMREMEWLKALNTKLPSSIRVLRCGEEAPSFHSRFSAVGKVYRYRIYTGDVLPPLQAGLAWHRRGLEGDSELEEIFSHYLGTHDFRAFSANRGDGKDESRDSVRTIASISIEGGGTPELDIRIKGNGFLYKMVRFLVGTAVYCREGRVSVEEIQLLLQGGQKDRKAFYCAPADGLTLETVSYPSEFESL